jgi:hypothetical protein
MAFIEIKTHPNSSSSNPARVLDGFVGSIAVDILKAAKEAIGSADKAVRESGWQWDTDLLSAILTTFNSAHSGRASMDVDRYDKSLEEARFYGIKSLTDTKKLSGLPLAVYTHIIDYLYNKLKF